MCLLRHVQVEESVVAGKLLLASMRRLRPAWHYELKDLLDMEMVGAGGGGGVTHTQHNTMGSRKAKQSKAKLAALFMHQHATCGCLSVDTLDNGCCHPAHVLPAASRAAPTGHPGGAGHTPSCV